MLGICSPGLPVLRFEVIFLVDLWVLKVISSSILAAVRAATFHMKLYSAWVITKVCCFLMHPYNLLNGHLVLLSSTTADVNENCPNVKIFQSKIVNSVPIENYSLNNATSWEGLPTAWWALGILQKMLLIVGHLIRSLELTLVFLPKGVLPEREDWQSWASLITIQNVFGHRRNKVLEIPFKAYGKGEMLRGERGKSSDYGEDNWQKQRKTDRDVASKVKNNVLNTCA